MPSAIHDHVFGRLTATEAGEQPWSLVILAALDGDASLTTYLAGTNPQTPPKLSAPSTRAKSAKHAPASTEPPGAYISTLTIAGFRGVGPSTTLPLTPGPGLTLVVGRNGSGKSSFAEGLELLLTGSCKRWEGRAKAWGQGWRNLHQPAATTVAAEVIVDGKGPLTVQRTWPADAALEAGATMAKAKGEAARPLHTLGWAGALATFRPFLSYNELGSMLEDGPSKVYDALAPVLGLDDYVVVQTRLADARKQREALVKEVKATAAMLMQAAERVGEGGHEPRAVHLAAALKAKTWDLAALRTLAEGGAEVTRDVLDGLRRLSALAAPDASAVQGAVNRLREAAQQLEATHGTDAARSLARARLLEQALGFHATHWGQSHKAGQAPSVADAGQAPSACPVCGAPDGLGADWRDRTTQEVAALKAEASAAQRAHDAVASALREARALVRESTPLPSPAAGELPSLQSLREAEAMWLQARGLDQPSALADHLEAHVLDLSDAVARVAAEAAEALARREDVWRPLGQGLTQWLPVAEQAAPAKTQVEQLKQAEAWWKEAMDDLRNERFAPIADRAKAIWQQLRLQSNVDLEAVDLEGTSTRRKVTLRVSVDGAPAEALGVMSQGELHSLALSLFLPRATLPDSPFRFICVDDPEQSMDPARVEGLARVLAGTATSRQVIVFTHDDRLHEAVRRLGIPARVLRVTRRAQSVVEVREALNPVGGYLADARAVLKTSDLRADVKGRVIPGFCRMALEAVCTAAVRERRLRKGMPHAAVDALLDEHVKLFPLMALTLFDDATRTGDVMTRLNTKVGRWAGDALTACNLGAHEHYDGDLEGLVSDVDKLARGLAKANA